MEATSEVRHSISLWNSCYAQRTRRSEGPNPQPARDKPKTGPRRALSAPAVSVPSTSCIVTTAATCIVQLSSFPARRQQGQTQRAVFRGGWDLPRPPPCPMAAHPSRGDVPWHPMASHAPTAHCGMPSGCTSGCTVQAPDLPTGVRCGLWEPLMPTESEQFGRLISALDCAPQPTHACCPYAHGCCKSLHPLLAAAVMALARPTSYPT
ncbi:hypothetical protein BGZ61DRAFT_163474 [Ilyonectria robusta]|uniref:uncharacterized protein n=1 Tax=Ilyonectria robusta TaxID=1079257 RepID=UPI001E8CF95A|nr:uncharacterized protein BGZ61DRAFT_163474 [Ilyonectria robusta]KAH8733618.1 hypothetical protein BGZ61DRAFT_163474 [Ilyonectria robusta]